MEERPGKGLCEPPEQAAALKSLQQHTPHNPWGKRRFQLSRYGTGYPKDQKEEAIGEAELQVLGRPALDKSLHLADLSSPSCEMGPSDHQPHNQTGTYILCSNQ